MLSEVSAIYYAFNESFPKTTLPENYLSLYKNCNEFVNKQPADYTRFDHFTFIRDYVNPLFKMNQQLIKQYGVFTKNYVDYSLNNFNNSIFSKDLYFGQNVKGIFLRGHLRQQPSTR